MGFHHRSATPDYDARHHTPRRSLSPSPVAFAITLMIAASAVLLWAVTRFPFASGPQIQMPAAGAVASPSAGSPSAAPSSTSPSATSPAPAAPKPSASISTSPSPMNYWSSPPATFAVTLISFSYDADASSPTVAVTVRVAAAGDAPVMLTLVFSGGDRYGQPGDNATLEHDFTLSGRTSYTVTDSVTALQFCYTTFVGVTATLSAPSASSDFRQLRSPSCT